MRKKIFSALLFGAVAMVSTSTLVSCKDYDDDISRFQEQIDADSKAISDIQNLIKSGLSCGQSSCKSCCLSLCTFGLLTNNSFQWRL